MKLCLPLCIAMFCTFQIVPVHAQAGYYCSEPSPPYCIDAYGTFDDESSFNRCKSDIESYISEVASFQSCLADWHSAASEEVDEAIERFNCKARGDIIC